MQNLKRKRSSQQVTGDSLYIIQNDRIPHEVKIHRSGDVVKRCIALQGCQIFRVTVHAVYPGCGKLEYQVHQALKGVQVQKGPGREWFRCEPAEAMRIITILIVLQHNTVPLP